MVGQRPFRFASSSKFSAAQSNLRTGTLAWREKTKREMANHLPPDFLDRHLVAIPLIATFYSAAAAGGLELVSIDT